jgi:hypothetical protein
VVLGVAAILGAAIGQDPAERDLVLIEERDHPVVQQLGGGDRSLAVVQLGKSHLGIGVDEGLLIDPAHTLQRSDIEGILSAAIAGAFAVEFAMGFLLGLGLLQRGDLRFDQHQPLLRHVGLERLEAF